MIAIYELVQLKLLKQSKMTATFSLVIQRLTSTEKTPEGLMKKNLKMAGIEENSDGENGVVKKSLVAGGAGRAQT